MERAQVDISVIIPVYNEQEVIGAVIQQIQEVLGGVDSSYEILVVDDGSQDETSQRAAAAGATVVSHPLNIGNGAAIKTGIRSARGKILVMMDGDGQHPPSLIPSLLEQIGKYDMVVGARTKHSQTQIHRDWANKLYNWLASYVSGRKIEDLTSGFRAVKADVARRFVYLLPNTFSYPTTITLAVLRSGRSLLYLPFEGKQRVGKSKIRLLRDGVRFFLIILRIATYYSPLKVFLPLGILMFLTGFGYGLYKVLFLDTRYGPTSGLLMTVSVLIFVVGLVSEQIAQLQYHWSERFDGTENFDD